MKKGEKRQKFAFFSTARRFVKIKKSKSYNLLKIIQKRRKDGKTGFTLLMFVLKKAIIKVREFEA